MTTDTATAPDALAAASDVQRSVIDLGRAVSGWKTLPTEETRQGLDVRAGGLAKISREAHNASVRFEGYAETFSTAQAELDALNDKITRARHGVAELVEMAGLRLPPADDLDAEMARLRANAEEGERIAAAAAEEMKRGTSRLDAAAADLRHHVSMLPAGKAVQRARAAEQLLTRAREAVADVVAALKGA